MTRRQRDLLRILRDIVYKAKSVRFGMDETTLHNAFARARAYDDIEKVLYGVLVDDPNNDYREDDVQDAIDALKRMIHNLDVELDEDEYSIKLK